MKEKEENLPENDLSYLRSEIWNLEPMCFDGVDDLDVMREKNVEVSVFRAKMEIRVRDALHLMALRFLENGAHRTEALEESLDWLQNSSFLEFLIGIKEFEQRLRPIVDEYHLVEYLKE